MDLDRIAKRNEERRELFSTMLKNGDDIEKIRAAALDYFDGRISEMMDTIDLAWGSELQIACIMKERYEAKREEAEKATTAAEIVTIVG